MVTRNNKKLSKRSSMEDANGKNISLSRTTSLLLAGVISKTISKSVIRVTPEPGSSTGWVGGVEQRPEALLGRAWV